MENCISTASLLALLSFLGAVLAALYARWTWYEAHKANDLAVHSNRVEIYRALNDLRYAVQSKGVGVKTSDVVPFFRPSKEARFYFSNQETSKKLTEYFDTCFALAECSRKLERPNISQDQRAEIQREQDKFSGLEESLFPEVVRLVEEELSNAVKRVPHIV